MSEQVDMRTAEMRRLQATVESYKLSNEELNVRLRCSLEAGMGGGGGVRLGVAC